MKEDFTRTHYYCPDCETEISYIKDIGESAVCRECGGRLMRIPRHETVAQWEARTGQKYPNTAPVYYCTKRGWRCSSFYEARLNTLYACVVATEAGAPPDDWRPEC